MEFGREWIRDRRQKTEFWERWQQGDKEKEKDSSAVDVKAYMNPGINLQQIM